MMSFSCFLNFNTIISQKNIYEANKYMLDQITENFHRSPYGNDEVGKVEEVPEPLERPVGPGREPRQDVAEGRHEGNGAADLGADSIIERIWLEFWLEKWLEI